MAYQNITPIQLGQAEITTGYTTVYTAPVNTRTYVKDINICNATGISCTVTVCLVPSLDSAGPENALIYNLVLFGSDLYRWQGVQIMNAGDTLQVKASATGATITVSGGEAV
jgi:hypothetical protein